jgi:hypothetical protein
MTQDFHELSDHAVLPESLISLASIPWDVVITTSIVREGLDRHIDSDLVAELEAVHDGSTGSG